MNIQKYFRVCVLLVLACVFAVPGFSAERIRYVIPGFDGSPKLMVDGQGLVRKQYRYAPFGEQILEKSSAPVATQSRRGFVGGQQESDNMVYLQQRYYNPVVGRFYQPDPVSYMAGGETQLNRYHYGLNDPYTYKDADGRVIVLAIVPFIPEIVAYGGAAAVVAQRYMPAIQNYATQAYVAAVRMTPMLTRLADGVVNSGVSSAEARVAVSLGERMFSTNQRTGFMAENVVQTGKTLTFTNFTVYSTTRGKDLIRPIKDLLEFASARGATQLEFQGVFSNPTLAAQFGKSAGDSFNFTMEANRAAVTEFLKRF